MKLVPIKDIFNLEKGTLQSSKATPGEYVFITAAAEWKTHKTYSQDKEALIFAAAASGSLGRTHYINGKFIASDLCFILSPKDTKKYPVNLQYYHQLFNSLRKEIVAKTKKGTSKDAISKQSLEQYCIPYLNIIKQDKLAIVGRQIAIKKNEFETEVSNQQKLITRLRQSILQDAVQGKLVPQDPNDEPASVLLKKIRIEKEKLIKEGRFKKDKVVGKIKPEEIPFEIPKAWKWCKVAEISTLITSGSRDWAQYYSQNGAKFVRMSNLSKNSFTLRMDSIQYVTPPQISEGKRTVLKPNDLLVSITGEVGMLGFIPDNFGEAYINQHTALIRFSNEINIELFIYLFLSTHIQSQLKSPQRGLKNSLRLTDIEEIIVPLPPIQEQKKIVEKVKMLFQQIDNLVSENVKQQKLVKMLNYSFVS